VCRVTFIFATSDISGKRPCNESRALLSAIAFAPLFAGRTSEGIGIGLSTLADVIEIFGQPEMLEGVSVLESDHPGWSPLSRNIYACYNGIEFYLRRVANGRIQVESYLKKTVVKIVVQEEWK
jgi:hypothetical protein